MTAAQSPHDINPDAMVGALITLLKNWNTRRTS